MKRRQKKVQSFLDSLKVSDRVITTGGMYGTIVKIADRSVKLQVADKVNIEISKAAISGLQGQEPVVADNSQA
jgi:preprotein translocase subunit YajC